MHSSEEKLYAGIILDQAIHKILDYAIPKELKQAVQIGSRVVVPLKTSTGKGTVWHIKNTPSHSSVKEITELAIEPSVLSPDLIQLAEWMSSYYATPLYQILKTLLPNHVRNHQKQDLESILSLAFSPEKTLQKIAEIQKKKPKQALLLEILLQEGKPIPLKALLKKAQASQGAAIALVEQNILLLSKIPKDTKEPFEADYFLSQPKKLSKEQQISLDRIVQTIKSHTFSTHLLYGVTGSGKTEIYLQAIEEALLQDKGVIFLVPEVVLASQTVERLKSRFEEKIAILHHRVSQTEKKESWHQIHSQKTRIIVGARSAIFSPLPNLGLVIVDEEQESAYKQTGESPHYHARDVAIMRAKICNATVVLGSATPSLESFHNAITGKYILSELTQRPGHVTMPKVHVVDMKEEYQKNKGKTLFSDPLLSAIKTRLSRGEQSLLLLNRRGYHTSQVCLNCSTATSCPHCDALLTFHLSEQKLSCHLCGYETAPSRICPSCKQEASMKFRGAGTEMAEKALYSIFPDCRILRMDADTTKKQGSHEAIFKKFRSGKADILVGTQMIAKGLHFPCVTLVGVLHADVTLSIPDFRASESLFQLITQVAGRSGRGNLPGEVFIQTLLPTQTTLLHAADQNYKAFFEEESGIRQLFDYPPFIRLIKVTLSGLDEALTKKHTEEARRFLLSHLPSTCTLLPIASSGHAKVGDRYHFQFIIKTKKILSASPILFKLKEQFFHRAVRLSVDIDPSSTFF
jgi:primosomal protein N' (replication factor Y) (superfamily II helicase)